MLVNMPTYSGAALTYLDIADRSVADAATNPLEINNVDLK